MCSNRWQNFRWSASIELIWTLKSKPNISLFWKSICIHLNLTQTTGLSLAGKMKMWSMNIDLILVSWSYIFSYITQGFLIIYMEKKNKRPSCMAVSSILHVLTKLFLTTSAWGSTVKILRYGEVKWLAPLQSCPRVFLLIHLCCLIYL